MSVRLLGLGFVLLATPAAALELTTLAVSHQGPVYHVVVDVRLDAPLPRVRAALLDVQALTQLDPSVTAARSAPMTGGTRVESEIEECLLGICRRLMHVQRVVAQDNTIRAETLPVTGSSFRSGIAHWQLTAEGEGTRLVFTADTEPDLWVPPWIGPPLVLNKLRDKTRSSLEKLEQLARE